MTGNALAEALLRLDRTDPAARGGPAAVREISGTALDALRTGTVIVPGSAGRPASAPSMGGGRIMWAFTDEEAYLAWASRQPQDIVTAWTPATVGGGRKEFGRVLEACGADILVVNPAGPGAVLWPATYVRSRAAGPSLRKASLEQMDLTLAEPANRASTRAAVNAASAAARAALAAGDRDRVDAAIASGRGPAGELGDLHSAGTFDELAVRARLDDDPRSASLTRAVLKAAYDWSQIGQVRECAALLVVGGQRAVAALEAGDPDPWFRQALGLVAAQLAILDLPEHRDDAETALAWVRRYPAGTG